MKITKEELIKIISEEISEVLQFKISGQNPIVEKDYDLEDCLEEEDKEDKEEKKIPHW